MTGFGRRLVHISIALGVACAVALLALRLPHSLHSADVVGGTVESVLEGMCAKTFSDNCVASQCCGKYETCFEKKLGFGLCRPTCAVGKPDEAPPWDPEADGKSWSCKVLQADVEAPTWTPSVDTPTLYCFAVALVRGNEPELLRRQLATGSGVFGCNTYSLFSEREMVLGKGPAGLVTTTAIGGPMSSVADNTHDFLRAYGKIMQAGLFHMADWTLKVDPDTVLVASRLRTKLMGYHNIWPAATQMYFRNCQTWRSVQGPLEIFTQAAAIRFFSELEGCKENPIVNQRGEDWFFGHCMESLGIHGIEDYTLLDDAYCTHHLPAVQCKRDMPAFHPFKTTEGYMDCLKETE